MSNLFQMKTQTLTLSHLSGLDANEPLSLPPVRKHDTLTSCVRSWRLTTVPVSVPRQVDQ